VPGAFWKDLIFSAAVLAAVGVCAAVFGPSGPGDSRSFDHADGAQAGLPFPVDLRRALYLPPSMETPFILIAPIVMIAGCWRCRSLRQRARRAGIGGRWRACAGHNRGGLGSLHASGDEYAVEPAHERVGADTLPVEYFARGDAAGAQGAVIFQAKQCRNCHSIGGHAVSAGRRWTQWRRG